jgi:UDP-glucose 4-epimerase
LGGTGVLEIISLAEKITGKKIDYKITGRRAGDPAELYASSAKAKKLLGWSAKFSDLETLICTTWDAYLGN